MKIKRKLFSKKDEERSKSDKKWDSVLGAGLGMAAGVIGKMKLDKTKSVKKLKNATNARINKVHDYRMQKVDKEYQGKINSNKDPFDKYVLDEVRKGKHDLINKSRKKMIRNVRRKKIASKVGIAAIPIAGAIIGAAYGHQNNLKKQRNKIEDAAGDRVAELIRGEGGKKKKE